MSDKTDMVVCVIPRKLLDKVISTANALSVPPPRVPQSWSDYVNALQEIVKSARICGKNRIEVSEDD